MRCQVYNSRASYAIRCPEASLSKEQKQEIRKMRKQLRASLKGFSRAEKKTKRMELHQHILDNILTSDEQKEIYNECRKNKKNKKGKKQT